MMCLVWGVYLLIASLGATSTDIPSHFTKQELSAPNYNGPEGMWCTGMNVAGFDLGAYGGRNLDHYRVPDQRAIQYFADRGSNCFRLPITWERLQTDLGDERLSPVDGYEETVNFVTQNLNSYAIIDPHNNDAGLQYNYGTFDDPRMRDATIDDFVKLWVAIATKWKNNSKVVFELYNEPKWGRENGKDAFFDYNNNDESGELIEGWRRWMQTTINAIRALGANNTILVPGLKHANCRDWDGASYWGESLDGYPHAGNTRLAALTDPAMRLVYDVHQYFDTSKTASFTGDQYGCDAHDQTFEGYMGAYEGCLTNMVAWAKKYNKKVMITEIASMADPKNYSQWGTCQTKMHSFLQRMNDSGVFLGYQVWQFGCSDCKGDLYALRPLNLDWYRFSQWMNLPIGIQAFNPALLTQANYAGQEGMWCTGLNAVGFDLGAAGGRSADHWHVPDHTAIRYLHDRGANCFRLPITWERMQTTLGDTELSLVSGYEDTVNFITEVLGDFVIIDPHNNDFGLQFQIGGTFESPWLVDASRPEFVRLWQAISAKWKSNPKVIFELYNEPKHGFESGSGNYFNNNGKDKSGQLVEFWRQWMQSTIDAIRASGANNTILVPGLKFSSCRDWDGASYWGASLDGSTHAGNTRLAALTDPAMRLVYDVHQYFDTSEAMSFTGDQYGCDAHNETYEGNMGADEGCLVNAVAWAKKYNKKFMVTEIASMADPKNSSQWDACQTKMHSFLQRMNESGVFLGYQVWQFGCPSCKGDLYAERPSNLEWYDLDLFGSPASLASPASASTMIPFSASILTTTPRPEIAISKALCTGSYALAMVVGFGHIILALSWNAGP